MVSKHVIQAYNTSLIATRVSDDMVHLKVPRDLLVCTVVPGISEGAEVELVLMRTLDVLAESLHLLGSRWLADTVAGKRDPVLREIVKSSITLTDWDRDLMWMAVPLERMRNGAYCMPNRAERGATDIPLLDCKTAILVDSYAELADSTLAMCTNSLANLMGECSRGCAQCGECLGSAASK